MSPEPKKTNPGVESTTEYAVSAFSSIGPGSSGIITMLITPAIEKMLEQITDLTVPYLEYNTGLAGDLAAGNLEMIPKYIRSTIAYETGYLRPLITAGIASGTGGIFPTLAEQRVGLHMLIQAYHGQLTRAAIEPWISRWANSTYRPKKFNTETAWLLSRIGELKETEFKEIAAMEGWSDSLITGLPKAYYQAPALPTLMDLLRRDLITEDEFKYLLRLMRLRDSDVNAITALKLVYLGTSDLAKLRSKGLIPDGDYKRAMAAHGVRLGWPDVLTEATYTQPSFDQSVELYWRGILKEADLELIWQRMSFKKETITVLKDLTKLIPPAPDLIRMVVREAFIPEFVIPAPGIFAENMTKKGYSKEWADRYWTAHFEPIELRQAYENLWRGLWTKEEFMHALHIKDIHPRWREDIYNVAFGPPGVRELGYGYDTGLYTVEDITKYRRMGGLSPEDAGKAAQAMVAYRTEAEREALRREAIADYTAGLDDETELRNKLSAIGGRPEIINLWVSRAKYREERDVKLDLVKIVKDQFVKGLVTEAELRSDLATIGVVPARINVHVAEAQTRRARYKREEEVEKKRTLTESKIAKAWELGFIGDEEYVSRLVERYYTLEDARLMLEIVRTPMPITPEEVARRTASVQSRINRTVRRYERLIAALDRRTGVVASEIESLELEMKEVLDVIDTGIAAIEEEIRALPPEILRKPILLAMERVRRRYERILTRLDRQASAAEEEITSTEEIFKETLDIIDVQIEFVIEELRLLGVAL